MVCQALEGLATRATIGNVSDLAQLSFTGVQQTFVTCRKTPLFKF